MKIVFDKIEIKQQIRVSCKLCGKRVTRMVSEWATVSPFNTKPNGLPKNHADVREDVLKKLSDKVSKLTYEGVVCRRCNQEPL